MILIDIYRALESATLAGLTKLLSTKKKSFAVIGTDGSVRLQDRRSKDSTQKRYKNGTKMNLGNVMVIHTAEMVLENKLQHIADQACQYGYGIALGDLKIEQKEYLRALELHLKKL